MKAAEQQDNRNEMELTTAQDYSYGTLHYCVQYNGTRHILTSSRELTPLWIARAQGTQFTTTEVTTTRFSHKGIDDFLSRKVSCTVDTLYAEIIDYVRTYVILPDEMSYAVVALWVMGTYVYRMFRYYPYIHLNAEKGSGKTTLLEILEPICFNGDLSSDSTGAALFHEVQVNGSTLLLDEAEDLLGREEGSKMRLLKAGFSKAGKIKRRDRTFNCYSPKMFAGIRGLDEVLADRTIRIRLERKLDSEHTRHYVETPELMDLQSRLRDQLYIFGLTHATEISDRYTRIDMIGRATGLRNRSLDLWAPLLIIAESVDEALVASLSAYARAQAANRIDSDSTDNEMSRLIIAMYALATTVAASKVDDALRFYDTDFVFAYLRVQGLVPKSATKTWLSRTLSQKLDIKCRPMKDGGNVKRMFEIDIAKIEDLYRRYVTEAPDISK